MSTPIGSGFRGPEGRIGYLLRQAHQALHGAIEREVHDLGLTAAQFSLLSALHWQTDVSISELAVNGMISQQATSETVRGLERKGLVERRPDARDRRIGRLRLTREGAAVFAEADVRIGRIEDRALAGCSDDERTAVAQWLVTCATVGAAHAPRRRGRA